MAYGIRRNPANGDCPGFKGDGICGWGATRQSDGHGRTPRPTCFNCSLKRSPPAQPNKRTRPVGQRNKRNRPGYGEQQTRTAPRVPRPAARDAFGDAFAALDGRGSSPVPTASGRPANGTQWDGQRRMHADPDSHTAWTFHYQRESHYRMYDPSWSTESHGWIQSQTIPDLLINGKYKTERTEGPCLGSNTVLELD